jgi:uncharacterized DUF497 family protein
VAGEIRFEWDLRKAESNRRKHGVDFEFGKLVFSDPLRMLGIEGDEHGETRWRTIGKVGGRTYVVSHTLQEEGDIEIVRIISVRRCTRREREGFEEAP